MKKPGFKFWQRQPDRSRSMRLFYPAVIITVAFGLLSGGCQAYGEAKEKSRLFVQALTSGNYQKALPVMDASLENVIPEEEFMRQHIIISNDYGIFAEFGSMSFSYKSRNERKQMILESVISFDRQEARGHFVYIDRGEGEGWKLIEFDISPRE